MKRCTPLQTAIMAILLVLPRFAVSQIERTADPFDSDAPDALALLLSRSDLSQVELGKISAAEPLPPGATSTLYRAFRILRRLESELRELAVDARNIENPGLISPLSELADWQGRAVRLMGQLQRITPYPLPPDLQDSFGTTDYFRCEVRLSGIETSAVVYTLQVPTIRPIDEDPDAAVGQPVSLLGLVTHVDDDETLPVTLVADQLLWHPQTPDATLGIDARHVWLAAQGVDLIALRNVTDKTGLTNSDFVSFYQLLSAARNWDDDQLTARKPQPIELGNLLQTPGAFRGSLTHVHGLARRIRPIYTERDVAERFDVRRYYEIALLIEVDPPIRIEAGDASRLFSRYPVVLCATSLPEGMPTGDDIVEPIEFRGVFLKDWAYPAVWLSATDDRFRQLSPLFIGHQPEWVAASNERDASSISPLAWLALGTMLLLIVFAWQVSRWNRQLIQQRRQAAARAVPLNLDDLDLEP